MKYYLLILLLILSSVMLFAEQTVQMTDTYKSLDGSLSMEVPANWNVIQEEDYSFLLSNYTDYQTNLMAPFVEGTITQYPEGELPLSISDYLQPYLGDIAQSMTTDEITNVQVKDLGIIRLSGRDYYHLNITYTEAETEMGKDAFYAIAGDKLYILFFGCSIADNAQALPQFEAMRKTLVIR